MNAQPDTSLLFHPVALFLLTQTKTPMLLFGRVGETLLFDATH
jgi:hypothetical protein